LEDYDGAKLFVIFLVESMEIFWLAAKVKVEPLEKRWPVTDRAKGELQRAEVGEGSCFFFLSREKGPCPGRGQKYGN